MMKLTNCTPAAARDLRTFNKMFDQMWNSMWDGANARYNSETARPVLRPAMDVIEEEDAVVVRVDLPGLTPEDVAIEVDGDLLTISGNVEDIRDEAPEADDADTEDATDAPRYAYRERRYGAFKRSLRLADTLDTANAAATFDNGVLTLMLPKREEAGPKRIAVQTGRTIAADAE